MARGGPGKEGKAKLERREVAKEAWGMKKLGTTLGVLAFPLLSSFGNVSHRWRKRVGVLNHERHEGGSMSGGESRAFKNTSRKNLGRGKKG